MQLTKTDYKTEFKDLYGAKAGKPQVVRVPRMNFIMVDGSGSPETGAEYQQAIQALYPLAYTLKFMCKQQLSSDFTVMPLESLWWSNDPSDFTEQRHSNWFWTAMIMQPNVVTAELFAEAMQQVQHKQAPAALAQVRFEAYDEGRAAQVLYVGPYTNEGPAIQQLHQFIIDQGGTLDGTSKHHHEIYLGDPRRTAPERLRTIIRQPF